MLCFLSLFLLIRIVLGSNTNLLSVLSSQPTLSKFTSLIKAYPDLLTAAQVGDRTIIAPNDAAFNTFFSTPSSTSNYSSPDQLYALMQYHLLNGTHPSYSITSIPSFIPTSLTDSSYTNVTTGQVVEAVTNGTIITFRSAVHQVSNIVDSESDIIFLGGLIHIVDAVMIPPLDAFATIAAYPLTYLIENLGDVLTSQYLPYLQNFTDTPDQTYFLVNDKSQAASVANSTQPLTTAEIMTIANDAAVPGIILYSANLTNGSTWTTRSGINLTVYEVGGDLYINDAKIITRDLLIANGVIQVIDKILDANDFHAHPYNTTSSIRRTTGLSTGAEAGIGIGIVAVVLGIITCMIIFIRSCRTGGHPSEILEAANNSLHEKEGNKFPYEMATKTWHAAELDGTLSPQELEARSSRFDDSPVSGLETGDGASAKSSSKLAPG